MAKSREQKTKLQSNKDKVWTRVIDKLEHNEPAKALDLIAPHSKDDTDFSNLHGVCLMRCGNPEEAVKVYRNLVLTANKLELREDVPVIYKVNFATALLLSESYSGGLRILNELTDNTSEPAVAQLQSAVDSWLKKFNLWQKLNFKIGGHPSVRFTMDSPGVW